MFCLRVMQKNCSMHLLRKDWTSVIFYYWATNSLKSLQLIQNADTLCHVKLSFLSCLHVCFVTSCFILEINSPLVSASLPFLICHQSDCLPWFLIVSTCSPLPSMCTYSLHLPLSCANVSCLIVLHTNPLSIVKSLVIVEIVYSSLRVIFFWLFAV